MSEQHEVVLKDSFTFLTNSLSVVSSWQFTICFCILSFFACFFKTFVVAKSALVRKVLNSNANSELNQIDLPFSRWKLKLNGVGFEQSERKDDLIFKNNVFSTLIYGKMVDGIQKSLFKFEGLLEKSLPLFSMFLQYKPIQSN